MKRDRLSEVWLSTGVVGGGGTSPNIWWQGPACDEKMDPMGSKIL